MVQGSVPSPAANSRHPTLPAQPTPLVGRADEVRQIEDQLRQRDPRLLTLVGAAGTGKTRLAIEAAGLAADAFPDGVLFVDLAPLRDPALVISTIARTLGVPEDRDRRLIEALVTYLSSRRILLLLDNFEQLLPAAEYLAELLQSSETAKLLVTSRAALNLRWEQQFRVPPLPVPDLARLASATELADVPAVALFLQRAQRVDPGFGLTEGNARTVAEICVQLDGLPLAIELAAARSRILPAQSLLARLQRRLDFLEGGALDHPRRQRTLRAALDWSYDLLGPEERVLFARLGVFVGGFALDAVGEVCDPEGKLGIDVLAGVESLTDKSLLRQERAVGESSEPRIGMLETIREYALERLDETGGRPRLRQQHAAYYLGGAELVLAQIRRAQQAAWLRSLEVEHDNIRAALAWCVELHEPELGLRAAGLLNWFWTVRGHVTEGRRWLASLLAESAAVVPAVRAEGLRLVGSLALSQSDYEAAHSHFEESLAISRELADPAALVGPLSGLGATAMQRGDQAAAWAWFEETLAIQRMLGDTLGAAESLNNLANLAHGRGDLDTARSLFEESLALDREIRYRPDVPLHNLAIIALQQGDLAEARQLFQESVAIKRALGDNQGLAVSLSEFGEVAAAEGKQAEAQRLFAEALDLQLELGDRGGIAFVLERVSAAEAAHGRPERALRVAAAASALRDSIGVALDAEAEAALQEKIEPARKALRTEAAAAAWAQGRAMSLQEVIAYALSSELVAPVRDTEPNAEAAARLTPREREVAVLVAGGLSNRQIAAELVLSERTADVHVSNILHKLDLASRAQLAAWVVRNGLMAEDANLPSR